jgi:hypothetical protein
MEKRQDLKLKCGDCKHLHLRRFISSGWEGRKHAYGKGYCKLDPLKKAAFLGTVCFNGQFSSRFLDDN